MNFKMKTTVFVVGVLITSSGCRESTLSNNGELVLTSTVQNSEPVEKKSVEEVLDKIEEQNIGDDKIVTRGLVAKMLTLAFYDMNFIDNKEMEINFSDMTEPEWYDKYINVAFTEGLMAGSDGKFMPNEPITLRQAQILLDKIDKNNKIKIEINDENKDMPISSALWAELYKKMLDSLSGDMSLREMYGVEEKNHVVLATKKNNKQITGFNMITDKGLVTFDGLNMDSYVDQEIRVLQKGSEVLAVMVIVTDNPTIKNAYVVGNNDKEITVFIGGCERTFKYENILGDVSDKICDVIIKDGTAEQVTVYGDSINGTVLKTTTSEIEIKNKGIYSVAENFKIYSTYDGYAKVRNLGDIVIGADCKFITNGEKIIGALQQEKAKLEKLRVVINVEDFKGLYHNEVSVSGTSDFEIEMKGESRTIKAWEVANIKDEMFEDSNRIYIRPLSSDGKIILKSINRNWNKDESPKYRGTFEIEKTEKGYIIINEISMDEYLYAVVPSEMPSSHGVEASKVQAVTARSYAYNQFYSNRFHSYGANVDDSVTCQVYNNIPENDTSIKAVDVTKGQFLTYKDNVISTNFFSTSWGMTANGGEVWSTGVFPAVTQEYLSAKKQYEGEDFGDLRVEANVERFLKAENIKGYDSDFVWFRWNVELTKDEITASINKNIGNRYSANPMMIKTLQDDGVFRSREISSIGEFVDMEIVKRGEAGNIMDMKIIGTAATVLVSTEYNIRALVTPYQHLSGGRMIKIFANKGTEMSNYSIMPSSFYIMEKTKGENGEISKIKFIGGGNGHGVGMSQNGVKGMIDAGFNFEQILKHYYTGTEVKKM